MRLSDLPEEILILITSFMQPIDILTLRKVCTSLYSATKSRIVWIEALMRVCDQDNIFRPTFTISDMSNFDLEHAAMGPHRFLNYMYRPEPSNDEIEIDYEIQPTICYLLFESLSGDDAEIRELFLVPGGRFLVSLHEGAVALWDLENYLSADHFGRYLEPLSFDTPNATALIELEWIMVHPTPDGLGLRIYIHADVVENAIPLERFLIYEVFPKSNNPRLQILATLDIVTDICGTPFYSMSFNRLIFLHGNVLKIWDYVTGAWASWVVDEGVEFSQIMAAESFITLLNKTGAFLWPIPRLSSSTPLFSGDDPQVKKASIKLLYPTSSAHDITSSEVDFDFYGAGDWYTGSHQPYIFDLVEDRKDTSFVKLWQYEVIVPGDDLENAQLHLRTVHSFNPNTWAQVALGSYSVTDQHLIAWATHSDSEREIQVMEFAYSSPNDADELGVANTSPLTTFRNIYEIESYSTASETLCASSGRLAWIDEGENAVYILDLLDRSNQRVKKVIRF